MTPQMIRLILGFLVAFVLLSIAPNLPALVSGLADPASFGALGDVLLYTAGCLALGVGLVSLHRRWRARPVLPRSTKANSDLGCRIRKASEEGARVPELARRFRLSHDAVRVAIGREWSRPAAPQGTSFRSRQPALPAKPKATAVVTKRTHYRALA